MDWNDLTFFLALAQEKTLTAAGAQLNVSASTVSRRIGLLEKALDVRLFTPHREGYELTSTGRDLVPLAEQASAQILVFERNARARDKQHAGPVCLEAPELLGQDFVLPMLEDFMLQYPDIAIELRTSVRSLRLVEEQADIVLRLVRPVHGPYTLQKIGQVPFGLYASKAYVKKHGIPSSPNDLHHHRIIGWSEDLHYLAMVDWLNDICPDLHISLRLNSLNAQRVAVCQGFGWAVLPAFAAKMADLVPCLTNISVKVPDLLLLAHEQSSKLPRVALVRDHLATVLKAEFHGD